MNYMERHSLHDKSSGLRYIDCGAALATWQQIVANAHTHTLALFSIFPHKSSLERFYAVSIQ